MRTVILGWVLLLAPGLAAGGMLVVAASDGAAEAPERARTAQLIEVCQLEGDEGVHRLGREMASMTPACRRMVFEALSRMKSFEAQRILLGVACGALGAEAEFGGAVYFVEGLTNATDARGLLASSNPEVQGIGLLTLQKAAVPLDANLMRMIVRGLRSTDLSVRTLCAHYLKGAGDEAFRREKQEALVESLASLETCPGAERRNGGMHGIEPGETMAELAFRPHVMALVSLGPSEANALCQEGKTKVGLAKEGTLIAAAWLGNAEALHEVAGAVRGYRMPEARRLAVVALGTRGGPEVEPLLRDIAQSDPYFVHQLYNPDSPGERADPPIRVYGVRFEAESQLLQRSRRAGGENK